MTKFFIKLKSALFTTLALGVITLFIPNFLSGSVGSTIFVFGIMLLVAMIGNMVVAIPVSYFSDFLTRRLGAFRFPVAGLIHIAIGLLPVLIIDEVAFYSIAAAFLFFLFTEWQQAGKKIAFTWKPAISFISVVSVAAAAIVSVPSLVNRFQERTHNAYMIPKGFEGEIKILHDMKNAPQEKTADGYDVITINESGYGLSAEPLDSSLIEDKYFFVDENGDREEIEKLCVSVGDRKAIGGEGYEYTYETLYVTSNKCGQVFRENGEKYFGERLQIEEILFREGLAEMNDYGYTIHSQK
ncbi:hypothetical protein A8F94_21185 [Bacillus sp. FJAT-27225]|uniref:DUF6843 domain-containing protein n=1 Tax=Bacillus sp. FJAT-27225 TaxID=1743144 RepID=UPI00080C2169|nr:hypothetical protein [Bacillus sp. FJAT-27225]OCA82419.1 hypothetical protein A8F94_21185 [Bacillus sp. FJAT-27225]